MKFFAFVFSDVLFKTLQNASLEQRGVLLREICIIDEHLQEMKPEDEIASLQKS